jgi:hypothetical protein
MADYVVTHGIYRDGYAAVQTLTPVTNLRLGDTVSVSGVGNSFNGNHAVYSTEPYEYQGVDENGYLIFDYYVSKPNQIIYAHGGHTDMDAYEALTGTLSHTESVSWIVAADVLAWLGIDVATANDTAFVTTCVNASNAWCYRKREQAGYTDSMSTVPSADVKLGTVMYAATLYRERGSVDSFASFDAMGTFPVPSTLGRIMQLLGCGRAQVA